MESRRPIEEWKKMLTPALESKVEEFQLMGYSQATNENIWDCLQEKVWKGTPDKRLHEVVQDIFHLGAHVYMSYLTVNAYMDDNDLMSSIEAVIGKD